MYPVLALDILLWGLFAMSVDLLLSYVGLLSFGHAAFWGLGAYAAAIVAKSADVPFVIAALVGAGAGSTSRWSRSPSPSWCSTWRMSGVMSLVARTGFTEYRERSRASRWAAPATSTTRPCR